MINSTFTEFASGDRLTDNATEFGVIRNVYADMYISSEDGIVSLNTSDGMNFPRYSRVVRTLLKLNEDEYREITGEELEDETTAIQCFVSKFSDGSPILDKPFIILRKGFLFTRKIS